MSGDAKDPSVGTSETPNSGTEEQETKAWLRTIESTVKWRDGVLDKMGCKRFVDEYKNKWDFLQASTSIPIIPINLVYAYTKTEIARMYFRDPWITVNAKRSEDLGAAQIAEQVVNYLWGELKLKQQIKQTLLETILVGHSWIKVGYVAEFGTVESQPKEAEVKKPGRPKKREVETNEYVKSESVFAYHVPYKDIVFDPSATFPATHNARWMAHKVSKPIRAIKESGIYENTDLLKPNVTVQDPNATYDNPDSLKEGMGKDVRSVVLWEVYDLDNQVIDTYSPGCPKRLRRVQIPDYLNGGFPFVQFAFNPVPGDVYPMSDIAPHEGQILELIKMVSIEMNHLKRWNRQLFMRQDALTPDEQAKFKDANDGAVIMVQNVGGQSLQDTVFPAPYAPVQQDIYGIFNQIYQLWQAISGQSTADQGGQARSQTRTLGELRMALQGNKSRAEEKVDVLEESIAEVARKILSIVQKKYDIPKMARIVGPKAVQQKILGILPGRPSAQPTMPNPAGSMAQPGAAPGGPGLPNPVAAQSQMSEFNFSWNRQDIMGDMDVDVLAGSTVPMDRESQLQIMEKMIPLLGAAGIQPGTPAARAYAREFMRLVGIQSLETVLDIAESQPPMPNPAMMQAQAKVQAKAAETNIKIQGQKAMQEMKLQAEREKLAVDKVKNHMNLQQSVMQGILSQFRNGVQNGQNGVMNNEQI